MDLFSKEKDLILKLTNLVLCLWLVISLVIMFSSLVTVTFTEKAMEYSTFEKAFCTYYIMEDDNDCKDRYHLYKKELEPNFHSKARTILINIGSLVIISSGLYLLNRKKDKK